MKKITLLVLGLLIIPFIVSAIEIPAQPICDNGYHYEGKYIEGYYENGECINGTEPECLEYCEPECLEYSESECLIYERICNTQNVSSLLHFSSYLRKTKCENNYGGDWENSLCCMGIWEWFHWDPRGEWINGECSDWSIPECIQYSEPECSIWSESECLEYEQVWVEGYWEGECVLDEPEPEPIIPFIGGIIRDCWYAKSLDCFCNMDEEELNKQYCDVNYTLYNYQNWGDITHQDIKDACCPKIEESIGIPVIEETPKTTDDIRKELMEQIVDIIQQIINLYQQLLNK